MQEEIKAIQKTLQQTNEWLKDLQETYDYADKNKAFVLLKATLKALRDRILVGEVVHLGGQLPALLRGYYFEGWDLTKEPTKDRTPINFLSTVRQHLSGHDDIDLEMAVPGALEVIFKHIDKGEAEQVKNMLPKEIQDMWP